MAPSSWEEHGAMVLAGRLYPSATEQPCTLFPRANVDTQNAPRGPSGPLAAASMEGSPADIWAADHANGAIFGGGTPTLSATLCRRDEVDGFPLQIQRDQRHRREQRRDSERDGHCPPHEKIVTGGGLPPCSFPSWHLNPHPLHRQHQRSQHAVPGYPVANGRQGYGQTVGMGRGNLHTGVHHRSNCQQQQRGRAGQAMDGSVDNGKSTGNDWSGVFGYGGGSSGCWEMAGGETAPASPKSSISSDGSWGGGLVASTPAAVRELDSTGEVDCAPASERKRKRSMGAVAENGVEPQQPQAIWLQESSASLHDKTQSINDLKELLPYNSMEMESAKTRTKEEFRKKDEEAMQLLQLLKMTSLGRDARELLQELLKRVEQSSPLDHPPSLSSICPDDPSVELTECKSNVNKYDGLPFIGSHQLHSYSPVLPLSDMVSTIELHNVRSIPDSRITAITQQPLVSEYRNSMTMELSAGMAKVDRASAIIDSLAMKKPLPKKGKLLQAVMEAGPLLRTLIVAGHLPQWRKPPPLKPYEIPPVSVRGHESAALDQNALLNPDYLVQNSAKAFHCQKSLVASSRVYTASSVKPSSLSSLHMRVPVSSSCASSYKVPFGRKQRI